MKRFDNKCKSCDLVGQYPIVRLWFDGPLMVHYCFPCKQAIPANPNARFGGEVREVAIPDTMAPPEWIIMRREAGLDWWLAGQPE